MNAPFGITLRQLVVSVIVAGAIAGLSAGCSSEKMSVEMAEQRDEMIRETSEWRGKLAQWASDHTQMRQWHASHPSEKAKPDAREKQDEHTRELTDHETKAGEFARDLEEHEKALLAAEETTESDRIAGHPALWAEHIRLRAALAVLESEHGDLVKEHVDFAGGLGEPVPGETPPNL